MAITMAAEAAAAEAAAAEEDFCSQAGQRARKDPANRGPRRGEALRWRLVLWVSGGLFLAMALPAVWGLIYTADDLGAFHIPVRAFYARSLASGQPFDWHPGLYGGFFLTGEGQVGGYHPLHWLLYRTLPLEAGFSIECLAGYVMAFWGTCLLLRRGGLSRDGAAWGGLAFAGSGFLLLRFVHVNAVQVIAHAPWALLCLDGMAYGSSARRLAGWAGLSVVTGSQLLLGYPQYVWYTLWLEGAFVACAAAGGWSSWDDRASCRGAGCGLADLGGTGIEGAGATFWGVGRLVGGWLSALVMGGALGAVQLLPTFEALGESVRATRDEAFASTGSWHPWNAIQWVAPYLFRTRVVGQNTHELAGYCGAAVLLLAVIGAVSCRDMASPARFSPRRLGGWLVGLGIVLALGEYGPVQEILGRLPVVGRFRFPCRAMWLVALGTGLLAACGWQRLFTGRGEGDKRPLPMLWLSAVVVLSVAAPLIAIWKWPEQIASWPLVCAGPALFAAAGWLMWRVAAGGEIAAAGLALFAALDLGCYGLSHGITTDLQTMASLAASVDAPAGAEGRIVLETSEDRAAGLRQGNQVLLRGSQRVDGYAGLEPARRLDTQELIAQRLAGVEWRRVGPREGRLGETGSNPGAVVLEPFENGGTQLDGWERIQPTAARARLCERALISSDPKNDLRKIDWESTALIEPAARAGVAADRGMIVSTGPNGDDERGSGSKAEGGTASVALDRPGRLIVKGVARGTSVLCLTESFHTGWRGAINGREEAPIRVNGDFLGIVVAGGPFVAEFSFQPASVSIGRTVSVCGLGLLVALFGLGKLGHGRRCLGAMLTRWKRDKTAND